MSFHHLSLYIYMCVCVSSVCRSIHTFCIYIHIYMCYISVYRINHIGVCERERDQREPSFSKCCFPLFSFFTNLHIFWIPCGMDLCLSPLLRFFPKYIYIKSQTTSFYNINDLIVSGLSLIVYIVTTEIWFSFDVHIYICGPYTS